MEWDLFFFQLSNCMICTFFSKEKKLLKFWLRQCHFYKLLITSLKWNCFLKSFLNCSIIFNKIIYYSSLYYQAWFIFKTFVICPYPSESYNLTNMPNICIYMVGELGERSCVGGVGVGGWCVYVFCIKIK